MASRLGVSRATKHIQRSFLNMQDLVSSGTVRPKKVNSKDNLVDLHATSVPVVRLRSLCELSRLRS